MNKPSQHADIIVTHRPDARCFEAMVDGQRAVAEYLRQGQVVQMTHTVVPQALEGRGIAAALVEQALIWIEREGLKVEPVCSYVRSYLTRHPKWLHLVA